jgi:demethylmenaquinone methyltransferase/2-methoxy-6-polyprenyl-1,4-benzoquinol methylase
MDHRLAEQADYYRARAGEYDDWWLRRGSYALPPEKHARWLADVADAESALADFGAHGDVLELACGTGIWTVQLAACAASIVAVDSAEEMLVLNRARTMPAPVTYLQADVFSWVPPEATFDAVVFGYWLSHVPDSLLAQFWARVANALRPGGRVFFVDSAPDPDAAWPDGDSELRRLADGRTFQVVKRYRTPNELQTRLADLGWNAQVRLTGNQMIVLGTAVPG